ncbi:MAG: SPOR domain-containing protein, partial [Gemmatimonadetes bacterium]|nr:SPOR domain-containing protein [Gemmatimonadota bacterium]
IVATLGTTWRNDLPLVGPDGWILMADSADVVDLNPVSGKRRRTYAGGASDLWSLVRWNGFRPRARGLDRPVEFEADSADTAAVAPPDSGASRINEPARAAAAPVQTPAAPPSRAEPPPAAAPTGWTLSFAALLDEQRARAQAATIRIDGRPARVVGTPRDGTMIWRVVAGPFATREEAERAGRRTGLPYWVYEDTP